jgi:hypothetical protein
MRCVRILPPLAATLLTAGAPAALQAANCGASGGLYYVGNTNDQSRSIWLSATSAGAFRLDAAQGNTTVDQWSRSSRGLNITASPFVSNGNGGTHKLYDTGGNKDCLLDTQNQKGGITLPPHIVLPGLPPQLAVPPIYVFPNFSRPVPPIANLPPRLPPQGITPGLPGGVTPPIGSLPPPQGITPGLPGGVTPPIGSLPPKLPPQGITPGLPGGVSPPVAGAPPGSPMVVIPATPAVPSTMTNTDPVNPPRDDRRCPDSQTQPPGAPVRPDCIGYRAVPVTPGRDVGIGLQADWNLWADVQFVNVSDGRYGLDVLGWSRTATVGIDRRFGDRAVAGFTASLENNAVSGYGGFFDASSRGVSFGPYVAVQLSDHWAADLALSYGALFNTVGLAVLGGSYNAQRFTGSVNLHAQYDLEVVVVRPRLAFSYAKTFSDGYQMQGSIFGQSLSVTFPSADYDYSTVRLYAEFNRTFATSGGTRLMPFVEAGALYEAVRPNGGQILSSDLKLVTPSPWSLMTRAGLRMLIAESILVEGRAGYLSFGQSGLNVVEANLRASLSF